MATSSLTGVENILLQDPASSCQHRVGSVFKVDVSLGHSSCWRLKVGVVRGSFKLHTDQRWGGQTGLEVMWFWKSDLRT